MENNYMERIIHFGGVNFFSHSHPDNKKDKDGFSITVYKLKSSETNKYAEVGVEFKDLPEFQKKAMLAVQREQEIESQRRKDVDNRWTALSFIGKVKPTKLKKDDYYIQWMKDNDIDRAYLDVSPQATYIYDRCISSVYTPWGIKEMDSWFCKQIRKLSVDECEFEPKKLRKMILCHAHLHELIKWNLITNLNAICKEIAA